MALTDPGLRSGRPATTTEVRSGPATDPLAWLTTAPAGEERWFWEVPEDDMSWVGLGATDVVSLDGPSRFDDAARRAAELLNDLDVEAPTDAPLPRLAAGFAFDDRRTFGSLFALDLESFFQRSYGSIKSLQGEGPTSGDPGMLPPFMKSWCTVSATATLANDIPRWVLSLIHI